MIGEKIDRIFTYGTPIFLFAKEMLKKVAGQPELQAKAVKKLVELAKGGRTRGDELVFVASLVSLSGPDATLKNKELFLKKHYELLHPNFTGKSLRKIAELKQKEKMAKGLIFLMAEDKTACDATCNKKDSFRLANEVWYGIFMGIKDLPDDQSRLKVLEKRILHFGKNHQERRTLEELSEEIIPLWGQVDTAAGKLGDVISSATNWVERQYEERIARAHSRKIRRKANWWNWLNLRLWFEQFVDLR